MSTDQFPVYETGKTFVKVDAMMADDEVFGLIKKLARTYHAQTGAMPPALSRAMLGLDVERAGYSSAARDGHARWRKKRKLKLVKGGAP